MSEIIEIKKCRACDSEDLISILDLGNQYVTNFVDKDNEGFQRCPLDLVLCEKCKLLQLKHNAPPE